MQLTKASQAVEAGKLEGSAEEVDTGKQFHFRSQDELIVFLRECFAETCRNVPEQRRSKNDFRGKRLL